MLALHFSTCRFTHNVDSYTRNSKAFCHMWRVTRHLRTDVSVLDISVVLLLEFYSMMNVD